jgi:hypothetical protein
MEAAEPLGRKVHGAVPAKTNPFVANVHGCWYGAFSLAFFAK